MPIAQRSSMPNRGTGPLDPTEIYDTILNEEAFALLPGRLAEVTGARSCTLGWWQAEGITAVMGHSGYFKEEHFTTYVENYADVDLWVHSAVPQERRNRVWNLDDLVPDSVYRDSRFFNDWIRGMGDDTFHCLGSSIVSQYGTGIIGLHRGRGAERFDGGETDTLNEMMPDLRRVLTIRGRILEATRQAEQAAGMLSAVNLGMIALDPAGRLVHANGEGDALLARGRPLRLSGGQVSAPGPMSGQFAVALLRATDRAAPSASMVRLQNEAVPMTVTVVPHKGPGGTRQALLMLPPRASSQTIVDRLRAGFGLTRSEAEIAVLIASGANPAEIAQQRGTSTQTVRSQMKALFGKLDCERQSQVASLVARLEVVNGR
jgi:DNA-binding CsgD family transcriptional regulator/PAS domain-containing protein